MTTTVDRAEEAQSDRASQLARALGRLIETERKRLDMSQEDLAERLGVSQNAVTTWERATRHGALYLPVILSLEKLFGLDEGVLLQRLGVISAYPDFEAVVLASLVLTSTQKDALIGVYRAMTGQ